MIRAVVGPCRIRVRIRAPPRDGVSGQLAGFHRCSSRRTTRRTPSFVAISTAIAVLVATECCGCNFGTRLKSGEEALKSLKVQMLKRQRAFSEELRQVKSSQPSHLSPSVSQAAASLGGADTGLVQRSQSLSKDSEALEGAPVKPPRNWEQSPQPPTSPRWSSWPDSSLGEQPSAWSAKSPQPSDSSWGEQPSDSSWGGQPSAWSAKVPSPQPPLDRLLGQIGARILSHFSHHPGARRSPSLRLCYHLQLGQVCLRLRSGKLCEVCQ
ncbi:uncharacterized protein LOC121967631 isoform X1 [Zingiber officinale]|uniref:uncharacterized protein LOC121967631 isoform X1 n=1 Tax=Zingiber officinale TaxID=94328 RepID=UPI001C4B8539|nr:uncharacterized protein LOC121967631 isoform X1 [Zingiber officinale]XP_042373905.1 uncharacterized protein LOC121967631 isoform X1 [Zingiber officinale]